jgi:hypothetical protein
MRSQHCPTCGRPDVARIGAVEGSERRVPREAGPPRPRVVTPSTCSACGSAIPRSGLTWVWPDGELTVACPACGRHHAMVWTAPTTPDAPPTEGNGKKFPNSRRREFRRQNPAKTEAP